MSDQQNYRALTGDEIKALIAQGCGSDTSAKDGSCDFAGVRVHEKRFDAAQVTHTHFIGQVRLGGNTGFVETSLGVKLTPGIHRACLINCTIGDDALISNVNVHLANVNVGDGAVIQNVGAIETHQDARFGNGVKIEPLNEGGGREVVLFNGLDSQIAHLLCVHRYREQFVEKLSAMIEAAARSAHGSRATIGDHVTIRNVDRIRDVNIGEHATIDGAASLVNGTILSREDAPTLIGQGVQAEDFIIAEGSKVTGGAIVSKSYVGQGCQIGKQYSAEGSMFFANCEAFHGEACSLYAGPYSVTHHKSTLLIAVMVSFYNAGSGTNQSNHMYKLGPVHEGKLERGCKTGSFSYMMWPCRVGPFSVVLGKHKKNFDTSEFPFSIVEAGADGKAMLVPGLNVSTVGTVRDGAKWPTRDRRKGSLKRDRIHFDVFSPLTVGRMIAGSDKLKQLQDTTDKSVEAINYKGAHLKRLLMRSGIKFYRSGIQLYLLEKVFGRVAAARDSGALAAAIADPKGAVYSETWVDVGGQLMPRDRLDRLCADVESGRLADLAALGAELDRLHAAYADDEWVWVKRAFQRVFEVNLDEAGPGQLAGIADDLCDAKSKFLNLILVDASKEFDEGAQLGFGQDGQADDVAADFKAVRGQYESNKFVKDVRQQIENLRRQVDAFKQHAASLSV